MLESILAHLPTLDEIWLAMPTIFSIILIEGLLSVDNSLIIATKARVLQDSRQRDRALFWGYVLAMLFRLLALGAVFLLLQYPVIQLVCGLYLVWVTCDHLGRMHETNTATTVQPSFTRVIMDIAILDLVFGIDNIVTAVAISPKMWIVVVGVIAGIATMALASKVFMKVVDRLPILAPLAYLIVGYIGCQIGVEYFFHHKPGELAQFGIIAGILAVGIAYSKLTFLHPLIEPVLGVVAKLMAGVAYVLELPFTIVKALFSPRNS
jgi:YkoY family integral membrane protein